MWLFYLNLNFTTINSKCKIKWKYDNFKNFDLFRIGYFFSLKILRRVLEGEGLDADELAFEELNSNENNADELNADEHNADEHNADEHNADELNADELNADELNADELNARCWIDRTLFCANGCAL